MTQEEESLLLKDLCARLPYNLRVHYKDKDYLVTGYGHGRVSLLPSIFSSSVGPCPLVEEIKPHLRPMSSMTEEEQKEFEETLQYAQFTLESYDWLNAHHFDFRNLIERGLAIKITEENNPYKK